MIDLNKEPITKTGILKYIDEVQIYSFYIGKDIEINQPILSPLREENNPSFAFFIGLNNEVLFKDFVIGGGDCVRFVEILFNISYFEALSKIAIDLGISDKFIIKPMKKTSGFKTSIAKNTLIKNKQSITLQKKRRDWKRYDIAYWKQFGIDIKTLEKYNVEPIEYIFINNNPIAVEKFAYCFIEHKDNTETYKIYQPYSKEYKWRTNHNSSTWQGWENLPEKDNILIITKGLKDVMSIVSTTPYASVALQTESIKPKDHIINQLKSRFKNIYLLYDNDFDSEVNWGQKFAIELVHNYNIENIMIPTKYKCKDYSDLWKKYNKKAPKILNKAINNSLPY